MTDAISSADPGRGLPHGVALAWGLVDPPQRGPRPRLSVDRIVATAIGIADAEGLAAVSMGRVGAALGVTSMSLYRYVTSKDDLLLLMQEHAAEIPDHAAPEEESWREGVRAWVLALRAMYRSHPWLVDVPVSGAPITPKGLAMVDWFLGTLQGLPLSDGEKMATLLLATSYVRATCAQERDLALAARGRDSGAAGPGPAGPDALAALADLVDHRSFPHLAPLLASGGYLTGPDSPLADSDEDFTFALERILDGIEHHVTRARTDAGPPSA